MAHTVTRYRRTDINGEPVTVYAIDPTRYRVYAYPGELSLFDGDTDTRIGTYPSVTELERAAVATLTGRA